MNNYGAMGPGIMGGNMTLELVERCHPNEEHDETCQYCAGTNYTEVFGSDDEYQLSLWFDLRIKKMIKSGSLIAGEGWLE